MKFYSILILLLLTTCSPNKQVVTDEILDIGTFNMEWLGDGINDINPRDENEYQAIKTVLSDLNFEILGIQEIENEEAIAKVIDNKTYDYYISDKSGNQDIGVIYKKDINIIDIKEYTPLIVEKGRTKPGLILTFKYHNLDAIVMIVHLKSTSRYDSTEELRQKSIELRREQANVLSNWIDSVLTHSTEKDLFIIGDFNDYPGRKNNASLTDLIENGNALFISSGFQSCKYDYLKSIDHIVISKNLQKRYVNSSVRMYDFYSSYPDDIADKISDHCPVLASFNVMLPDDD